MAQQRTTLDIKVVTARDVYEAWRSGKLAPAPFQRTPRWSDRAVREWAETLEKHYPAPPIIVFRGGDGRVYILDGLNRVLATVRAIESPDQGLDRTRIETAPMVLMYVQGSPEDLVTMYVRLNRNAVKATAAEIFFALRVVDRTVAKLYEELVEPARPLLCVDTRCRPPPEQPALRALLGALDPKGTCRRLRPPPPVKPILTRLLGEAEADPNRLVGPARWFEAAPDPDTARRLAQKAHLVAAARALGLDVTPDVEELKNRCSQVRP